MESMLKALESARADNMKLVTWLRNNSQNKSQLSALQHKQVVSYLIDIYRKV